MTFLEWFNAPVTGYDLAAIALAIHAGFTVKMLVEAWRS